MWVIGSNDTDFTMFGSARLKVWKCAAGGVGRAAAAYLLPQKRDGEGFSKRPRFDGEVAAAY